MGLFIAKSIIAICNENEGFISALLTIVTTVLTVRLSLLPFKKKVIISDVCYGDGDSFESIDIYVANKGNEPIFIQSVRVTDDNGVTLVCVMNDGLENNLLSPQAAQWYHYELDNFQYVDNVDDNHINIEIETVKKTYRHKSPWAYG